MAGVDAVQRVALANNFGALPRKLGQALGCGIAGYRVSDLNDLHVVAAALKGHDTVVTDLIVTARHLVEPAQGLLLRSGTGCRPRRGR